MDHHLFACARRPPTPAHHLSAACPHPLPSLPRRVLSNSPGPGFASLATATCYARRPAARGGALQSALWAAATYGGGGPL